MKKFVYANSEINMDAELTNKAIVQLLKERGIDTTMHNYELNFIFYDRFDSEKHVLKFKCPGDYLACISLLLHETPNAESIKEYWGGSVRDFVEGVLDIHPDVDDLVNAYLYQEEFMVRYLKNLDTGAILAEETDDEGGYYEEEDYDWED